MPPTILVVDDELVVCQVTCRMLQEAGYTCEGVYSARAALGFLGASDLTICSCLTFGSQICPG
jgi:CheY-like chemotaxis protein